MPARGMLDEVYGSLDVDGREALDGLTRSAVVLGIDLTGEVGDSLSNKLSTVFTRKILQQADQRLVLDGQARELQLLDQLIYSKKKDSAGVKDADDGNDLKQDEEVEQTNAQTAQFSRDTKQVNLKIMEYEDRVKSVERHLSGLRTESIDLQDVLEARRHVEQGKAGIAALQQRLAAFHGLPPDLEASRSEVRRAMKELESLKGRRDELFERMGSG